MNLRKISTLIKLFFNGFFIVIFLNSCNTEYIDTLLKEQDLDSNHLIESKLSTIQCTIDVNVNNWVQVYNDNLLTPSDEIRVFCFSPGIYEDEIMLVDQKNIHFYAPTGGVILQSSPTGDKLNTQTLKLENCENIEINNITILNNRTFPITEGSKDAMAIRMLNSKRVIIDNCTIKSNGKSVVRINNMYGGAPVVPMEGIVIKNSTIEGYYFLITATRTDNEEIQCFNTTFNLDHDNSHAAFWGDHADFRFVNCSFEFNNGKGFLAGRYSNTSIVGGEIINSEQMDRWISRHPSYFDLKMHVSGGIPFIKPFGCDYWCNKYCKYGDNQYSKTGNRVLYYSENNPNPYSVYAPGYFDKFLDTEDYLIAGDFLNSNSNLLFFNNSTEDVAINILSDYRFDYNIFNKEDSFFWKDPDLDQDCPVYIDKVSIDPIHHGGWMDNNDRIVAGDFLGDNKSELLFFNTYQSNGSGAFKIMSYDQNAFINSAIIPWDNIGTTDHEGWIDNNDRIVAGDFLGDNKSELLFFNTNQSNGSGAFKIMSYDQSTNTFANSAIIPWDNIGTTDHEGWIDNNDRIVAGDFLGDNKSELLFFNTNQSNGSGAFKIMSYDQDTNAFVNSAIIPWDDIGSTDHASWMDNNDRIVAGDFLGEGKSQLLFFNTYQSNGSGAFKIMSYDQDTNAFVNKVFIPWDNLRY